MTTAIPARLVRVRELPAAEQNPGQADPTGNPLAPVNEVRQPRAQAGRSGGAPPGDRRGEMKQNYVDHLDLRLSCDLERLKGASPLSPTAGRYPSDLAKPRTGQ